MTEPIAEKSKQRQTNPLSLRKSFHFETPLTMDECIPQLERLANPSEAPVLLLDITDIVPELKLYPGQDEYQFTLANHILVLRGRLSTTAMGKTLVEGDCVVSLDLRPNRQRVKSRKLPGNRLEGFRLSTAYLALLAVCIGVLAARAIFNNDVLSGLSLVVCPVMPVWIPFGGFMLANGIADRNRFVRLLTDLLTGKKK